MELTQKEKNVRVLAIVEYMKLEVEEEYVAIPLDNTIGERNEPNGNLDTVSCFVNAPDEFPYYYDWNALIPAMKYFMFDQIKTNIPFQPATSADGAFNRAHVIENIYNYIQAVKLKNIEVN